MKSPGEKQKTFLAVHLYSSFFWKIQFFYYKTIIRLTNLTDSNENKKNKT